MRIKLTKGFKDKLNAQVEFIAKDKPAAARKFKNEIISRIKEIPAKHTSMESQSSLTGKTSET